MLQVIVRGIIIATAIILTSTANYVVSNPISMESSVNTAAVSTPSIADEGARIDEESTRLPLETRLSDPANDSEGQILNEASMIDLSVMTN